MGFGYGFGFAETAFPVMFSIAAVLIFGTIVVIMVRGIREWNKNNRAPALSSMQKW